MARQAHTEDIYEVGSPGNPGYYDSDHTTDTIVSTFAHADARVSCYWTLSAGLRIDRTRSEETSYAGGFAFPDLLPITHGITYETPLTPEFGLSYKPNESNFIYATIAKGFRIGGINTQIPASCQTKAPSSYTPDTVWIHEIGAKNLLFDGRLQIAGSIFEIDWRRVQTNFTLDCGFNYVANAGAARSTGFDLAVSVFPLHGLTFNVALGYDNVHFTQTVLTPPGKCSPIAAPWSEACRPCHRRGLVPPIYATNGRLLTKSQGARGSMRSFTAKTRDLSPSSTPGRLTTTQGFLPILRPIYSI